VVVGSQYWSQVVVFGFCKSSDAIAMTGLGNGHQFGRSGHRYTTSDDISLFDVA
jgi:hypothetical protein